MSLTTEDMLVGASILSLIDSLDELSESISYRFSRGEKKSCYLLTINEKIRNKSLKIGLYIKRSRKRLSPWRYTFTDTHQHEIEQLLESTDYLFLMLITDQEGIAVIDYPTLKQLLDDHFDETEWISVTRKLRENYRVSGKNGKLDRALAKNAFPRLIIDYIENNLCKNETPDKDSSWIKRLINKKTASNMTSHEVN